MLFVFVKQRFCEDEIITCITSWNHILKDTSWWTDWQLTDYYIYWLTRHPNSLWKINGPRKFYGKWLNYTSASTWGCFNPHLAPLSPLTQGHLDPFPHQKGFVSVPGFPFPDFPLSSKIIADMADSETRVFVVSVYTALYSKHNFSTGTV